MTSLDARELYRFYHAETEETFALRGVSLAVEAGEIVAVTGPSGSGKSTLLACLAGLDDPDGGTVTVAGERISRRPEAVRAQLRARHIGVLLQSTNLVGHLDVTANIRLARGFARKRAGRAPEELLDGVGIASRAHAYPAQLSGGEAARAGLAVALANDPDVLLADEPTGELDTTSADAVLSLLVEQASRGAAVVIVTHSDAIAGMAHRVIHIEDGTLQ
ncbi:MAG: putative transport system ATP-binding protein [Actinomycetota bacterium]|jgi:putative ABC transport system ATP-binding protein|nr:putative transport system ATP-binding protein [Actinomycetota bacterium]